MQCKTATTEKERRSGEKKTEKLMDFVYGEYDKNDGRCNLQMWQMSNYFSTVKC